MKAPRLCSRPAPPEAARGRSAAGPATAAALALVLALVGAPPAARAALVIQTAPIPITAPAGGTGSFEVLLADTGGTFDVGGFSIDLSVPAGSGITFTGADTNTTTAPYIFGTLQSPPPFATPDFPATTFPAITLNATDTDFAMPSVTLNAGEAVGLALVHFAVTAGTAPGPVTVTFKPAGTSVSDAEGRPITGFIPPSSFTITVTPVPEPSAILLLGSGGLAAFALLRTRRRAAWAVVEAPV